MQYTVIHFKCILLLLFGFVLKTHGKNYLNFKERNQEILRPRIKFIVINSGWTLGYGYIKNVVEGRVICCHQLTTDHL